MCDPITIAVLAASAAASAAGSYQKHATAEKAGKEQRRQEGLSRLRQSTYRAQERERQDRMSAESQQRVDEAIKRQTMEEQTKKIADQFDERQQRYDAEVPQNPGEGDIGLAQPVAGVDEVVRREAKNRLASSLSVARQQIRARAFLETLQGQAKQNAQAFEDDSTRINTINSLRRGSLGVYGGETQVPVASVRPGSTLLGDILTGVGQLGMAAGGYMSAGGGAAAAPAGWDYVPNVSPNTAMSANGMPMPHW